LTSFLLSILLILGILAAKAQSGSYRLDLSSWVLLAMNLTWASLSLFSWLGLGSGRRTLIARIWLALMSCVGPYTVLDVGLGLVLIEKLKSIEFHDERVTVFRSVLNKLSGSVRKSPGRGSVCLSGV
jgi:hypothetical protein